MALNVTSAINFLKNTMYNTTDKLARESTKTEGNNYYVSSANGFYYSVMEQGDAANALEQITSAVQKKSAAGKGALTIYSAYADVIHPTWKEQMKLQFQFQNTQEENWGSLANGALLNNNATGSNRSSSENKINNMVIYVVHEMCQYRSGGSSTHLNNAKTVWRNVIDDFDDDLGGYTDDVTAYREAYKQGLVKMCSDKFSAELSSIGVYEEPSGMWDSGLQNAANGGIFSRYIRNSAGDIVNNGGTNENTEATACIILGYR